MSDFWTTILWTVVSNIAAVGGFLFIAWICGYKLGKR